MNPYCRPRDTVARIPSGRTAPPALARDRLIIMVKEPQMGRVKTRLAREIGAAEAARFYRTISATIIRRLARDRRWQTLLAVSPDTAVASAAWPADVLRFAQQGNDIGERMLRALMLAEATAVRTVLIGSDIVGITAEHIAAAFRLLRGAEVVFGPAEDGGFWLIGARRPRDVHDLFKGVRWSDSHTLADCVANLGERKANFAAKLSDVDDAASLRAAISREGYRNAPKNSSISSVQSE